MRWKILVCLMFVLACATAIGLALPEAATVAAMAGSIGMATLSFLCAVFFACYARGIARLLADMPTQNALQGR